MLKQEKKEKTFLCHRRKYLYIVTNYSLQKFHSTVGKEIPFVKMTKETYEKHSSLISKMLLCLKNWN